jgi:hypothetical protein
MAATGGLRLPAHALVSVARTTTLPMTAHRRMNEPDFLIGSSFAEGWQTIADGG